MSVTQTGIPSHAGAFRFPTIQYARGKQCHAGAIMHVGIAKFIQATPPRSFGANYGGRAVPGPDSPSYTLVAWDDTFPANVESLPWKVYSVVTLGAPACYAEFISWLANTQYLCCVAYSESFSLSEEIESPHH